MAVCKPTPLTRMEPLIRAALPLWGINPRTDITFLSLSENAIFQSIDPRTGQSLVFRLHRPDYHNRFEIDSEISWLLALRGSGIPVLTPKPVAAQNGSFVHGVTHPEGTNRLVSVLAYIPGLPLDQKTNLLGWFKELGKIAAQLHRHSRQWSPPAAFQRKTWNLTTMLQPDGHWGNWRTVFLNNGNAALLLLDQAIVNIRETLRRYNTSTRRFGLIHADLRLANVLRSNNELAVIDFDDCGFGWFMYDFAAAVSFFENDPVVTALADTWLDGYRSVTSLDSDDEAVLPALILARRLLLTAWMHSRPESELTSHLTPEHIEGTLRMAETFLSHPINTRRVLI